MATRLTKYSQQVFGSTATLNQMAEFGSLAAASPLRYSGSTITPTIVQALSEYLSGWFGAVIGTNSPCIEDMNSLFYLVTYQLTYLMQQGIAEWDTNTTYFQGSMINSAGSIYTCINDLSGAGIAGGSYPITNTTYWRLYGNNAVQIKSSNYQIVSGDKMIVASGTNTQTLPDATLNGGNSYEIVNGGTGVISIGTISSQLISKASSYSLVEPQQFVVVRSDNFNWQIVGAG